jgi:hypothetical protein
VREERRDSLSDRFGDREEFGPVRAEVREAVREALLEERGS